MDPSACRVIYIDDRFNTERWISREGLTPATPRISSQNDFSTLPADLQANVNAFLSVFNQVFVCNSGRSFSTKLGELHDQVKPDSTPIIACFDIGSESRHGLRPDSYFRSRPRPSEASDLDSPLPSPLALRREITFSSESDESYGLQLLSRIASDLQVDEGVQLIIPVAIVKPRRKDSYDHTMDLVRTGSIARAPYGSEAEPVRLEEQPDIIDPALMLQCLEAGALDVVKSPLDKAGIMGLTVHAFRVYKSAMKEQASFMAIRRGRKQSWVGVEEEKPYAYLREAMVKKLLKGICEPQHVIEDYQHRDLYVEPNRKQVIAEAVGKWSFDGHLFSEDELVYAGYYILNHAVQLPELERWRVGDEDLLHFMQGCRVAYNSFVLYHNFRHAVDVLQSLFYFLLQIGTLPPYPIGSDPPPKSQDKSPIAKLLGSYEAMSLLISAIGHDVGHPGVNNMFLVKLNAPLAQLYNDQSVLEAFHCAAYSQILRRHWPAAFNDKGLRRLMISSILATDMGVHSDYMQQLGHLQEKIHESKVTDGWSPKDIDAFRVLTCGLLIKCADISNVARPWIVAEKWTHLLQKEFAKQGEMEEAVGIETTLFGGPPELGNSLKLANGQIGFMTIFAHPLFANVADIIPAMGFAADEILTNKGVWFTRAEHEKLKLVVKKGINLGDGGAVSPRTQSPSGVGRKDNNEKRSYFPSSPLRQHTESPGGSPTRNDLDRKSGNTTPQNRSPRASMQAATAVQMAGDNQGSRKSSKDSGRRSRAKSRDLPLSTPNGDHDAMKQRSGENILDNYIEQDPRINNELTGARIPADNSRDVGVSIRAGTTTIPSPEDEKVAAGSGPTALGSFTFATSDRREPVRRYDPEQHYPAVHNSARASVPMVISNAISPTTSGQSESNTTSTNLRGGDDNTLTPSHSTETTSYMSDKSEDFARQQRRNEFEFKRSRAASAPMQVTSPNLRQSFSVSSTQSGSQESSGKPDIYTRVLSNGDLGSEQGSVGSPSRGSKSGGTRTLGRKRSRIKMGLTFWKKKRGDDENQGEEVEGVTDDRSSGKVRP